MECREALEAIHEALDREAPQELPAALRQHLRDCPSCAREHDSLTHWDQVLRAGEPDQPTDAYFASMARTISARVAERERPRAPLFAPSWSFAGGLAVACLALGVALGRFALPSSPAPSTPVTRSVPGPVREVVVPQLIEKPVRVAVRVPVVKWRTRVVTRRVVQPSPPPAPTVAAVSEPAYGYSGVTYPGGSSYGTCFTGLPLRSGGAADESPLSRAEVSALARRLTADASRLDSALNSPRLADALISNVNRADVELEKALDTATPEAEPPSQPTSGGRSDR
jgi:hypothetical protein